MNVLAIDLGTSGLKALVFDENLSVLGHASAPVPTRRDLPGQAEQDPNDWLAAMARAVPLALESAKTRSVDAIALTGQMSAPCFVGNDGHSLAPVQTLTDTRCAAFVRDLPTISALTGNLSATFFGRAKIEHVLANIPEMSASGAKIISPKDYLRVALGGSIATDASDAANHLLIDPKSGDWSAQLIAEASIPSDLLPNVQAANSFDGVLNATWAARFGLTAGIPLVIGAGDMATTARAGRIGTSGRLLASIGTSATTLINCPTPLKGLIGRLTFHSDGAGNGFALGSHFNGGACLDWFHAISDGKPEDRNTCMAALSLAAESRHPAATDPLFLSSLLGAGSPDFNSDERGAFFGLSASHDRVDLFRAVLEGISFELQRTLQALVEEGLFIDHILANGGGMNLGVWPQLLADITGHELHVSPRTESSAEGAAILALEALHLPIPPEPLPSAIHRPDDCYHAHFIERVEKLGRMREAIR